MSESVSLNPSDLEAVLSGERSTRVMRDVLVGDGPDTVKFLHSQLSQDVESMVAGDVRWSFLLQPSGKLVGLLRVVRGDGDLVTLDTDAGNGSGVLEALNRFKIRTKCDLVLSADQPFDATWAERLPHLNAANDRNALKGGSESELTDLAAIVRGFPRWGRELDEATIPNATGVVALAASFTKGCYTGQELVERIDSRGGNVPRRLVGLDFTGQSPAQPHDELTFDAKAVGVLTALTTDPRTMRSVALAYVKRDIAAGTLVSDASGLAAEVREIS